MGNIEFPKHICRIVIFIVLSAVSTRFLYEWIAQLSIGSRRAQCSTLQRLREYCPSPLQLTTGFVTDFLDTLGIGSFATTTTIFKLGKVVPDELIPGTMNIGHALPTILQAFIYINAIQIDLVTLILLIGASVVGAWCGAGLVSRLPRRAIQVGIGGALSAAVVFMAMGNAQWFPTGGAKLALHGFPLIAAMAGTCLFGALNTLGIGFYAPCMILVSLLGMKPIAAFPIMMGSAAFLMPVGGLQFIRSRTYDARSAVGLGLGGLPAVLMAAFIVRSLPVDTLRWLVMAVASWAAILLFRSGFRESLQKWRSKRIGG